MIKKVKHKKNEKCYPYEFVIHLKNGETQKIEFDDPRETLEQDTAVQEFFRLSGTDFVFTKDSSVKVALSELENFELIKVVEEPQEEKSSETNLGTVEVPVLKKGAKKDSGFEVPKGRKRISKSVRYFSMGVVVFLGLSGGISLFQSSKTSFITSNLRDKIVALQEKVDNPTQEKDETGKLQNFFGEFIPIFMNVSTDGDAKTSRTENLKSYFDATTSLDDVSGERALKSVNYYEFGEDNGMTVARYVVKYSVKGSKKVTTDKKVADPKDPKKQITQKVETEEEVTTDYEQLLNIPYVEKEGVIAIADYPYFSATPVDVGTVKFPDYLAKGQEVSATDNQELFDFIEQFYGSYATSSPEDMQYLMNEPECLGGDFSYTKSDNRVTANEDGSFEVLSVVTFTNPDTTVNNTEHMELKISKVSGKYFVEKLNHVWEENKDA